jgi:nucleoside transporter
MSDQQPLHKFGGAVFTQLSVMMFLQFFVWGAWYVSMTGFINAQEMGDLTGAAYMVGPIAAIASPFFLGMVADRFFSSKHVLAVMMLLSGAVMFLVPSSASPFSGTTAEAFKQPFILLLLFHMLCYMPTLGLSSSVALNSMTNSEKQFPIIRVWGTIGWIVGNIAVSFLPGKDASASQFYLTGGAAVLLGLFSFTLPKTPPPLKGQRVRLGEILGIDSLKLMANRSYMIFVLCSFLICIPLAAYYQQARNFAESTGTLINGSAVFSMSLGQMSEIFFMLVMPFFFVRLGVKWMLAVGMLAWVIRYGLFAGAADNNVMWMVFGGILLHGICYDFFFVTGQIYVDQTAGKKIRSQAQGFYVLITQGLGMLIGAQLIQMLAKRASTDDGTDWKMLWTYPAVFALIVLVIFVLFFKHKKRDMSEEEFVEKAEVPEPI